MSASAPANVRVVLREKLDPSKLEDFDWLMGQLDAPSIMPIFGYMTHVSVEHQDWTFWEVLREARKKFKPALVI